MVSDRGVNYAVGNLLAGPAQWKRMYSTGASLAFLVNMLLTYLGVLPAMYTTSNSARVELLVNVFLELANAMMPLVAIAFDSPLRFVLTVLLYVIGGLLFWTVRYEFATSGF